MSSPIDDYLDRVERHLVFDRKLATRARGDIEEYCHDAAAARQIPSSDAERLAVEGFGEADAVARLYAAAALGDQVRKTWLGLAGVVVGAFIAMRLRTLTLPALVSAEAPLLLLADRLSLGAGLLFAVWGWLLYSRPQLMFRPISARAAFEISLLAIGTSILVGTLRALGAIGGWTPGPLLALALTTLGVELAMLLAVRARVRRLGCYFDRALTSA